MPHIAHVIALLLLVLVGPGPALAQPSTTLPGGARSLSEQHGDWNVRCAIRVAKPGKVCGLVQEQFREGTGRLLAIDMFPDTDGVQGRLVLPFGLDLDSGVGLSIDDGAAVASLRFKTCMLGGCLVPSALAADVVAALRSGTVLRVKATGEGGREAGFVISLAGWSGALDRAVALLQ